MSRNADSITVGFSPLTTDLSNVVYMDTIRFDGGRWHRYSVLFDGLDSSMFGYVVFSNLNNTRGERVAIDNVTVMEDNGCGAAENIRIVERTPYSLTLAFDDVNGVGNYKIGYSKIDDPTRMEKIEYFDTTTFTLDDLESNTRYYIWIAFNCEDGVGRWIQCPMTITECVDSDVPYVEDFDGYSDYVLSYNISSKYLKELPECWSFLNLSYDLDNYPLMYISEVVASEPSGMMHLYHDIHYKVQSKPLYVILPKFEHLLSDLKVAFRYYNDENAIIELGVMTDILDTATFRGIRTYTDFDEMRREVHGFSGDGLDINLDYVMAFRISSVSDEVVTVVMDDIEVNLADRCEIPEVLKAVNIGTTDVTVNWIGDANEYEIQYRPKGEISWVNGGTFMDTIAEVGGLDGNVSYELRVRSLCGNGVVSEWCDGVNFKTRCGVMDIPYFESFDDYNSVPDCWSVYKHKLDSVDVSDVDSVGMYGKCLKMYSMVKKKVWVALSMMGEVLDSLCVRLSYHTIYASMWEPWLEVGITTDLMDKNSFRLLDSIPPSATMRDVAFNLSQYGSYNADSMYYIEINYPCAASRNSHR